MRKFKVGDRIVLIDCSEWTDRATRKYIGHIATVTGYGMPEITRGLFPRPPEEYYEVTLAGTEKKFYPADPAMKLIPPDDFNSDETPNKVVSWDSIPHFRPERESA